MTICKTAIISPNAKIGKNVTIGSYCVIGDCVIDEGCTIHPHAYIGDAVVIASDVEVFHGAVIGKEPKGAGSTARPIEYKKFINIGKGSSICPHAVIYYDVEIGSNTLIGDGASIREQCKIGNHCLISRYVTFNYNVSVGNNVKIMDLSHITGNTVIEDNVFISALVGTANDNKITEGYGDHVLGQFIKEDAIIGLGAKILPDVEIGYRTVVGAAALVTRNIAEDQLVKGIPAKEIKN
ncbi:MAG: hypothetical protein P1U32_07035 [Legionellaceae bacterium]|nr:hypothetical protein [Legionellaceae bacterium]